MSTLNATLPSIIDVAQRTDPNGSISKLLEMLALQTPLLEDATWIEGNLPTGHKFSMRDGLPTLTWRKFNQGVAASKSTGTQVVETVGQLAGRSNVDVDLANLNGNAAAFRASEDMGFMQAFRNSLETAVFYSSQSTTPEQIMGFAPRLDATTSPGGSQILLHDGSASGADQTSIWLVGWSPDTVSLMYPKGSKVGLEQTDMGKQYVVDSGGTNTFTAFSTEFKWNIGVVVKDWRYLVRIANVDTGNLSTSGNAVITSMMQAIEEKLMGTQGVRPVFYVNRKIASFLRVQADNKAQNTITHDNIGGKPVTMFGGIPVRRTDALLNTEAAVA